MLGDRLRLVFDDWSGRRGRGLYFGFNLRLDVLHFWLFFRRLNLRRLLYFLPATDRRQYCWLLVDWDFSGWLKLLLSGQFGVSGLFGKLALS